MAGNRTIIDTANPSKPLVFRSLLQARVVFELLSILSNCSLAFLGWGKYIVHMESRMHIMHVEACVGVSVACIMKGRGWAFALEPCTCELLNIMFRKLSVIGMWALLDAQRKAVATSTRR